MNETLVGLGKTVIIAICVPLLLVLFVLSAWYILGHSIVHPYKEEVSMADTWFGKAMDVLF